MLINEELSVSLGYVAKQGGTCSVKNKMERGCNNDFVYKNSLSKMHVC